MAAIKRFDSFFFSFLFFFSCLSIWGMKRSRTESGRINHFSSSFIFGPLPRHPKRLHFEGVGGRRNWWDRTWNFRNLFTLGLLRRLRANAAVQIFWPRHAHPFLRRCPFGWRGLREIDACLYELWFETVAPQPIPLFALWGFVKGVVALPSSFFAVAAEQKSTRFLHLLLKEFKSCLSIYEKGITARKQLDMERKFLTFFLHHLPRRNSSTFSPNQKRDSPPSDLMGGYWHPAIPNTTHESPPTNPCMKHLLFHAGIFD